MHQSADETFASNDLHTYHVCFPLFNLVWVSLVWSGRQTVRVCFLGLEEKKKKKACSSSLICWFRAGVCGMLQINTRTARVGGWDTQRTSHSQCHCELSTVKLRCWFSAVFFKACFGVFSPSLILHRFCRGGQIKYDNKAEGSCAVRANCHFLYVLNLNCRHSALLALQSAELTSFYQYPLPQRLSNKSYSSCIQMWVCWNFIALGKHRGGCVVSCVQCSFNKRQKRNNTVVFSEK